MTPNEMIEVLVAGTALLFAAGVGFTLLRYVWKRIDRSSAQSTPELVDLQARVAELEAERGRMGELEERLEFAERLLAQARDPEQLPRQG